MQFYSIIRRSAELPNIVVEGFVLFLLINANVVRINFLKNFKFYELHNNTG